MFNLIKILFLIKENSIFQQEQKMYNFRKI
jgi:hypothetical protein